jgi:hypothetical protein
VPPNRQTRGLTVGHSRAPDLPAAQPNASVRVATQSNQGASSAWGSSTTGGAPTLRVEERRHASSFVCAVDPCRAPRSHQRPFLGHSRQDGPLPKAHGGALTSGGHHRSETIRPAPPCASQCAGRARSDVPWVFDTVVWVPHDFHSNVKLIGACLGLL